MPKYEITSPDGARFEITAPEGASHEQVLAYAQSQQREQRSVPSRIGEAAMGGFMRAGPVGMALGAGREAASIGDERYGKMAYEAGGGVTDIASKLGASPEVAAGAGYAANVGLQAIPTALSMGVGRAVGSIPMEGAARSLMHSAIKPRTAALKAGKVDRAVDTMLERGVSLSQGGLNKLQAQASAFEDDITRILDKSPATVDKFAVAATLKDAFAKVQKELNPQSSIQDVQKAFTAFINHPLLQGNQIPVKLANEMKQAAYRKLGDAAYGAGVRNPATELAEKTLARGFKENIGRAVPEVSPILKEQADVINAIKVMQPQALIEANKNPVGLGLLAQNPQAAMAFAVDRSGFLKSLLARGMYSGAKPLSMGAGGLLATDYLERNQ